MESAAEQFQALLFRKEAAIFRVIRVYKQNIHMGNTRFLFLILSSTATPMHKFET